MFYLKIKFFQSENMPEKGSYVGQEVVNTEVAISLLKFFDRVTFSSSPSTTASVSTKISYKIAKYDN